jgi:hypothetical protein
MWRALHSTAYASWPVALMHGLNVGRAPAPWVTASYFACVLLVVVALLVRLSVNYGRRDAFTTQTTGAMQPVGKSAAEPTVTATGSSRRRRGGGEGRISPEPTPSRFSDVRAGSGDMIDSWAPAGDYRTREVGSTRSGRYSVPVVPQRRVEEERPAASTPMRESARPWTETERPSVAADTGRGGGRHSRDAVPEREERIDLVSPAPAYDVGATYLPPDDTPTLVDLASRRAMRAEGGPSSSRSARRKRAAGDDVDAAYWSRLRGEAQ